MPTSKTKVVLPVHMQGAPARMDKISYIAKQHGLLVLEDAAQGVGCSFKGKPLGTIGHAGIFSFDAGKTLITGEGGMVVTNEYEICERGRAYHDHGHPYREDMGRG